MRPIPCLSFNIKKLPFKRSEKGNFFIFKLNERHEGENDGKICLFNFAGFQGFALLGWCCVSAIDRW
jgi:hypothetical protein